MRERGREICFHTKIYFISCQVQAVVVVVAAEEVAVEEEEVVEAATNVASQVAINRDRCMNDDE